MITKQIVLDKLKEIYEPCAPIIDIVRMGMIDDIQIEDNSVKVSLILTTPNCPARFKMVKIVKGKLEEIEGIGNAEVVISDKKWSPDKLSEEDRKRLGFV
ncbi:metal-sulfur cluster assembly factor [Hippea sp. KM1]|uniref:metal-sulfur cluster assembly factor n=1 Tax=Hippea sp. KM1 TaxID=944481 RepID=UPI00046D503A|nr:iron-sulfur cluster assembly protein [Hippea sp. KM1]